MEQLGRQENSREVGDDDDDDDDSWLSHLDEIFEDTSGTNGQHVNKPPKSIEILYPVPDTPKITSLMPATPLHHRHYGLSAPTVCRPQESYRQDHKVSEIRDGRNQDFPYAFFTHDMTPLAVFHR